MEGSINQVVSLLPTCSRRQAEQALLHHHGDIHAALNALLDAPPAGEPRERAQQPQAMPAAGAAAAVGRGGAATVAAAQASIQLGGVGRGCERHCRHAAGLLTMHHACCIFNSLVGLCHCACSRVAAPHHPQPARRAASLLAGAPCHAQGHRPCLPRRATRPAAAAPHLHRPRQSPFLRSASSPWMRCPAPKLSTHPAAAAAAAQAWLHSRRGSVALQPQSAAGQRRSPSKRCLANTGAMLQIPCAAALPRHLLPRRQRQQARPNSAPRAGRQRPACQLLLPPHPCPCSSPALMLLSIPAMMMAAQSSGRLPLWRHCAACIPGQAQTWCGRCCAARAAARRQMHCSKRCQGAAGAVVVVLRSGLLAPPLHPKCATRIQSKQGCEMRGSWRAAPAVVLTVAALAAAMAC